jgi:predicted nuclease of predicted toxin-antitoxin system
MKFKIDENLPVELAGFLSEANHDVATVHTEQLSGVSDLDLINHCRAEMRTLITLDLDFSDIRTYPPEHYPGLLVLRLKRQDKRSILRVFASIIHLFETEMLDGKLWLVEEDRVRIRE